MRLSEEIRVHLQHAVQLFQLEARGHQQSTLYRWFHIEKGNLTLVTSRRIEILFTGISSLICWQDAAHGGASDLHPAGDRGFAGISMVDLRGLAATCLLKTRFRRQILCTRSLPTCHPALCSSAVIRR